MLAKQLQLDDQEMVLPMSFRPAIALASASFDQVRTVAGMAGIARLSFDQTAVEAVARMQRIEMGPSEFDDLFILQQEGLRLMSETA